MTCPSMPHSTQASATAFCTVSEQLTGLSWAIVWTSSSRPRRAHTASAVESTSATTASRASRSVSRMSTSISTWPGTMLLAPGRTLTAPTVPTVLPVALASAAASTANAISAAPRNASRRSPIGVVPAWAAVPVTVRRRSCGAAIALTIPRREPRCSSTAPCSMWSSTKRSAYPSGRRASWIRSGSIESALHGLRERDPLPVGQAPGEVGAHVADERPGAEAPGREARLLGGDGDDLDRAARRGARAAQAIDGLDRGEHAVDAVERTGVERGVEVGADEQAGPAGAAALETTEGVPGRVATRAEAGLGHPSLDQPGDLPRRARCSSRA